MLARVKHETTVTLQELTGSEEASMTFFAVRRWYGWGAGPILNLDIGGGSFEMAFGQDELPELATSVPLGASRLTRDWLHEDPPSAKSVKELRRYIRATLKPAVRDFEELGRANLVAGTSKTFRSLARIAGAAPSAAGPYVKRELYATDLGLWAQRISAMDVEDRLHLPGVSEARAHQLLAGALVAEAALELFEFTSMEICPWALREGLILRRLDQLVFEGPLEPAPHVTQTDHPAVLQSPDGDAADATQAAPADSRESLGAPVAGFVTGIPGAREQPDGTLTTKAPAVRCGKMGETRCRPPVPGRHPHACRITRTLNEVITTLGPKFVKTADRRCELAGNRGRTAMMGP